jgi:hypothetical protein
MNSNPSRRKFLVGAIALTPIGVIAAGNSPETPPICATTSLRLTILPCPIIGRHFLRPPSGRSSARPAHS